MEGEMEGAGR